MDTLRGRDSTAYHPRMSKTFKNPLPEALAQRIRWLRAEYERLRNTPRVSLLQLAFTSREIDHTEKQHALAVERRSDWQRLQREEADFLAQTNPALKVINGGKS